MSTKLYLGNLSYEMTETQRRTLFFRGPVK
jgi:hypothetical protein